MENVQILSKRGKPKFIENGKSFSFEKNQKTGLLNSGSAMCAVLVKHVSISGMGELSGVLINIRIQEMRAKWKS